MGTGWHVLVAIAVGTAAASPNSDPWTATSVLAVWSRSGVEPQHVAGLEARLEAGEGCLVAVTSGHAPAWRTLSLEEPSELRWHLPPAITGTLVRGSVIVHDAAATPATVTVAAQEPALPPLCREGLAALGWLVAPVSRHGEYQLGPLPPGTWRLTAHAKDHFPQQRTVSIRFHQGELTLDPFLLEEKGTVAIRVSSRHLAPPYTLAVLRPSSQPLTGRREYVTVNELSLSGEDEVTIELPPGEYRARLAKVGDPNVFLENFRVMPGEQQLILEPEPVTVRGKVLRGERSVAGARLRLSADGEPRELVTDPLGGYEFTLWRRDRHLVEVEDPDGAVEPLFVDSREAEVGSVVHRDLVLSDRVLRGTVVAADSRRPLPEATVVVRTQSAGGRERFFTQRQTDEHGGFTVFLKEDSEVELTAQHPGYLPTTQQLGKSPPAAVVIALEQGVKARGRVVAGGAPVPGARVVVPGPHPAAPPAAVTTTDAHGAFQLTVVPGSFLVATAPGFTLAWARAGEGEVTLSLQPPPPPTVLVLRTRGGEPVAGARVSFQTGDGVLIPFSELAAAARLARTRPTTDERRELAVAGLPPGTYHAVLLGAAGLVPLGVVGIPSPSPVVLPAPQ